MLVLEGLTRYYGDFLALDHLDMRIGAGELHGFVGPNGAGKTTTMRILSTLLLPSAGRVTVNGVDVAKNPKQVRKMVGYMPDFFGVYDRLKSWEYLDFYARCYGFPRAERQRMANSLLELVNLQDKRDTYVDVLSRGMKQRLCLARALIHDPSLLILDEPASGMDPRARAEMKAILKTLKEMGKTVLISSHILPELSEMCDSLTIIDRGRLVFSGSVAELGGHMSGNAPIRIRLLEKGGGERVAGVDAMTMGAGSASTARADAMNTGAVSMDAECTNTVNASTVGMDTVNAGAANANTVSDVVQKAVTLFKQFPGVTGITQEEPLLLSVSFEGDDAAAVRLLRKAAAELPVVDFHRIPMNLEKVFMEVTEND